MEYRYAEHEDVCAWDIPREGIQSVNMVSIAFDGDGQIMVNGTEVLTCNVTEGN